MGEAVAAAAEAITASLAVETIPSLEGTVYCEPDDSKDAHLRCIRSGRVVDYSAAYSG